MESTLQSRPSSGLLLDMSDHNAITLRQQVAVQRLDPGRCASIRYPTRLGSLSATGFGEYTLAIAVHAAYQETREDFHLYSVSGHFIQPVSMVSYTVMWESQDQYEFPDMRNSSDPEIV